MNEIRRSRSVYILPNLLTTGTLFFGFYAVVQAFNGHFEQGAWGVVAAAVCDMLDGRVARAMGATSLFGKEYDSLADFLAFGMAPAALFYQWALAPFNRVGWAAAFLYTVCGALRLARFNVQHQRMDEKVSKRYFQGLPIPGAAGVAAVIILFYYQTGLYDHVNHQFEPGFWRGLPLFMAYLLGILMVSTLRFRSFKDFTWHRERPFLFLVFVAVFLTVLVSEPVATLFIVSIAYLLSVPYSHREYRQLLQEGAETESDEVEDLSN